MAMWFELEGCLRHYREDGVRVSTKLARISLGLRGLRFRVLGFRVLGFRVWGLGVALIQVVFVQTSHHICPSQWWLIRIVSVFFKAVTPPGLGAHAYQPSGLPLRNLNELGTQCYAPRKWKG